MTEELRTFTLVKLIR